jgi:hypothetical protein
MTRNISSRCLASWLAASFSAFIFAAALGAPDSDRGTSEWVHANSDGKLVYKTTAAGDRITDFSYAGYMGGGVVIPDVPVIRTVRPTGGADDSDAIQAVIDEVAGMPPRNDFRGAVLLAPGAFPCSKTITISASGIVLRGSGAIGEKRTTLKLTGSPHLGIGVRANAVRPGQAGQREDEQVPSTAITDTYVASGATQFSVVDASGFRVGDAIEIRRPVTEAWVKFMQMDDMVRDGKAQTWVRVGNRTNMERRVTGISGKTITVDIPLTDSFDAKYLNPPGPAVAKVRSSNRLSQIGIEQLHIESPPQEINHTEAHYSALRMNGEDCWVREVVCDETMNSIGVSGRRITLQRVAVDRKARHQGSSKPAEFAPNASQLLLDRCSGSGDNIWYAGIGSGVTGPIVMLNCTFSGNGRVESHQRWSTAMLYDNCRVPDGGIDFRNRGSMGSGHGWTMGWGVAWNCVAKDFIIQTPPGAANWMIGCIGESKPMPRPFGSEPMLPEGTKDSHGIPVAPASLYLAQLAERLGPQALKNIGY